MYHIRTSCVITSYAYESQIKIKYTLRNIKLIIISYFILKEDNYSTYVIIIHSFNPIH